MSKVSGLEGIVAAKTELSLVDGDRGRLVYRGYYAQDLVSRNSFEEVVYLLWHGKLPTQVELCSFEKSLLQKRELPELIEELVKMLPQEMELMEVLRTCISALADRSMQWPPTVEQAVKLLAKTPLIIASRYRLSQGLTLVKPHPELGHVANYLYMLTGEVPKSIHIKALEAYFILTLEHGMNASTFAARVVSSTESDLVSALTGAIGTMKGPLHGGAPSGVIDMLNKIKTKDNAEQWLRQALEQGERLMGFGHRVYKTEDPRSIALREITKQLAGEDQWLDLANEVERIAIQLLEEFKPGRRLYTNVEFYAAAIMRAINMPSELFTPTFTASRTAGWCAHVLEQAEDNRIYRPQSEYIGPLPKQ